MTLGTLDIQFIDKNRGVRLRALARHSRRQYEVGSSDLRALAWTILAIGTICTTTPATAQTYDPELSNLPARLCAMLSGMRRPWGAGAKCGSDDEYFHPQCRDSCMVADTTFAGFAGADSI